MAYDIYGNHLRPGHCEVHPDTRGDYPCSCCIEESHRHELERAEIDAYEADLREQWEEEMRNRWIEAVAVPFGV